MHDADSVASVNASRRMRAPRSCEALASTIFPNSSILILSLLRGLDHSRSASCDACTGRRSASGVPTRRIGVFCGEVTNSTCSHLFNCVQRIRRIGRIRTPRVRRRGRCGARTHWPVSSLHDRLPPVRLAERKAQLARASAALEAEDARDAARASLAESLREAASMYVLTLAELSRRSATPEEFLARLMEDEPVDLSAIWRARRGVRSC